MRSTAELDGQLRCLEVMRAMGDHSPPLLELLRGCPQLLSIGLQPRVRAMREAGIPLERAAAVVSAFPEVTLPRATCKRLCATNHSSSSLKPTLSVWRPSEVPCGGGAVGAGGHGRRRQATARVAGRTGRQRQGDGLRDPGAAACAGPERRVGPEAAGAFSGSQRTRRG
jgi:hypothetical protein